MAIISTPNVGDFSTGEFVGSGQPYSLLRTRTKRNSGVLQEQERHLNARKSNQDHPTSSSARSGDNNSQIDTIEYQSKWLRPFQQRQISPHRHLRDADRSPATAEEAGGTTLDYLVAAYAKSEVSTQLHGDTRRAVSTAIGSDRYSPGAQGVLTTSKIAGIKKPQPHVQFLILSRRTWRNLYRDPMLMLTHYVTAIIFAAFLGFLFYGLSDDMKGFQNRWGLFLFLLALFGFSTLTSLTVFGSERLLFLRERSKGYYSPIAYYLSKVFFDIIPLRLLPPMIIGCLVYPMTGLVPRWSEFFKFISFIVLFNLASAMICLFIGICVWNQEIANLLGVLVMLFSLLFGGLLLNHETIPKPLLWLQSLSIFHFGFEGLIVNEVRYLSLIDHKYGLDIEVPGSAILSSLGFNVLALWNDATGLAIFCGVFFVLGYLALHFLLVETR